MLQLPEIEARAALRRTSRSPAQIAAGDAAKAAAFAKLEYIIEDLVQMTSIASTLIESYDEQTIDVENTSLIAKQTMQQLKKTGDQLRHMTYDVEQKALALRDEWHAASAADDFTFEEKGDQPPADDLVEDDDADETEAESAAAPDISQIYSDMDGPICELKTQATLAMEVFNKEELFLRAVEQLDRMLERFQENYFAKNFGTDL